jgi:hypothetical protein
MKLQHWRGFPGFFCPGTPPMLGFRLLIRSQRHRRVQMIKAITIASNNHCHSEK